VKLIITASIKGAEFEPLQNIFSLNVIKAAAKKASTGLGKTIKSSSKIPATCLKKIPLTSSKGAGRTVFLLQLKNKKTVLVMIRLKNDKKIGRNMTIQNPKFKKALNKNINLILKDLSKGNYEEFELD